MTRANRYQTPALEIQLLREGIVESVHRVHAVVCDSRGRPLSVAGDGETSTFVRSALKPFQALAVTASGTLETYGLDDRDLALACGSHQGTLPHIRQAFHILWKADIEPSRLKCPTPAGATSPLAHNCSGKHAAMLAVCKQQSWPLDGYLERNHPLQKQILFRVAELLAMPADEFIGAHDDCGAPTYVLQLPQMATLYAKLSSGDTLEMERIVRAMTHHPEMVSGEGGFDTTLMAATGGALVSKSGAEGIQCIARVGQGLGLALKVEDGAKRAKYAAAIHLLRQLGWITPEVSESLGEQYLVLGAYKRLDPQGELALL